MGRGKKKKQLKRTFREELGKDHCVKLPTYTDFEEKDWLEYAFYHCGIVSCAKSN